ncbi:MAG: 2,3-bisphosphoglycerate-independent phosphoglycerate mutase [Patescibacteria group bacterium]|jgi:2,3-bisphosphoglycerate-independent phosphoglycerate mutase
MSKVKKIQRPPFVLVVLDGWGISKIRTGNAIALAKTPHMDAILRRYPHSLLGACGRDAGLPPHQDGNSEAGHMNIGAGRIVEQDSVIISKSINDGSFFKNPAFISAIQHVQRNKSKLHIMGLMTAEQSAHADPDHLLALITLFRLRHVSEVYLHLFTDGRDSYQFLAPELLSKVERSLQNGEKIATIAGRFYAMDRIHEWDRTKMVYDALTIGTGHETKSAQEAILQAYNRHENDEYLRPTVINPPGKEGRIGDNDAIIFFNLRSDRVRQLTKAFVQKGFDGFRREKELKNLCFVTLTDFGPDLSPVLAAYPSRMVVDTLPFALKGLRQLYVAETEKYAHVTYFFNGGYDQPVAGEDRVIIKSPEAYTYRDKPAMSANKLTNVVLQALEKNKYDFIVMNYANADMVGHTGDLAACIKAVEVVDSCLGKLVKKVIKKEATMIITADHGNIEEVKDIKSGQINTSHSGYPVPFILVNKNIPKNLRMSNGVLADIAPTILDIMDMPKPQVMGNKLLCKFHINQQS